MNMKDKFIRFIKSPQFIRRLSILLSLVMLMIVLSFISKGQYKTMKQIEQMKDEARRQAQARKKNSPKKTADIAYSLEGTMLQAGEYLALINGNAYRKGQTIDNYKIADITLNRALLLNPTTNETKELFFKEDSSAPVK